MQGNELVAEHRFKEFLQSRQWGHDPDRRFVDDAMHDQQLPDATSWDELEAHLANRNAAPEMRDSARAIWQLYVEKGR